MVCSHIAYWFQLNIFFFAGYVSNIYIASSCFVLTCFFPLLLSVLQGDPGANFFENILVFM